MDNGYSGVGCDRTDSSRGGWDYWIVKTDEQGRRFWDRTYGTEGDDKLGCILATPDNGYLLCGYSSYGMGGDKSDTTRGMGDYWIVKTDSLGQKEWDKTYGGNAGDYCYAACLTSDGGYILVGLSWSAVSGDKTQPAIDDVIDYWIVKIDSLGNKIWDRTYGTDDNDVPNSIIRTHDDNYLIAGSSKVYEKLVDRTDPSRGEDDWWFVKIDEDGNKLWHKAFGGNKGDWCAQVVEVEPNVYVGVGATSSGISGDKTEPALGEEDVWVLAFREIPTSRPVTPAPRLSVYPNPNKGAFRVRVAGGIGDQAQIEVQDVLGRAVLRQDCVLREGANELEVRLPSAAPGVYILGFSRGGRRSNAKIIVE